ncbi:glutamate mutase L [Clostridiaceae bacterium OttesenSCG-928-D20]|nr:glutamate mutase L [Clostridiaceae bacterium OttesenSCG-928-D20]
MAGEIAVLIDVGSTFTKVSAVDLKKCELIASASSPTTAESDINLGIKNALKSLETKTGTLKSYKLFACSSAAGGLKMAASGLVPELTAYAAKQASLGAGAKLTRLFSYELTRSDLSELSKLKPDIFLLCGGTDGGNRDCIIHNAEMLSKSDLSCPIIFAGNRSALDDCSEILADKSFISCKNVMPSFGVLDISDVKQKIRELFISRIIQAKGLSALQERLDYDLIPTPSAVLSAMSLYAKNKGDMLAIDLGGATTDVYSMADGLPENDNTVIKGLREPYEKRTVEGDLGMRYSAGAVVEALGLESFSAEYGFSADEINNNLSKINKHPETLEIPKDFDQAIVSSALSLAIRRHAGTIKQEYTPAGKIFVQEGKDLRKTRRLILTGGALINNLPKNISEKISRRENELSLIPESLEIYLDKKYILSAVGLLAEKYPDCAISIMEKEISLNGTCE